MGIAELLRNYIQKRVDEEVNKEIEAIAKMVQEATEYEIHWEHQHYSPSYPHLHATLPNIVKTIRKRKR
jgi:acetylornithine deacetylase/succinyl-diaminopimelate desuccinylase-like protein